MREICAGCQRRKGPSRSRSTRRGRNEDDEGVQGNSHQAHDMAPTALKDPCERTSCLLIKWRLAAGITRGDNPELKLMMSRAWCRSLVNGLGASSTSSACKSFLRMEFKKWALMWRADKKKQDECSLCKLFKPDHELLQCAGLMVPSWPRRKTSACGSDQQLPNRVICSAE